MISFGLDATSTIHDYRKFVTDFNNENEDNKEAYKFEMTPAIEYAISQAYIAGFNDGAAQMTGVHMMKHRFSSLLKIITGHIRSVRVFPVL